MKMFNDISFGKIKPNKEYFVFEYDSLSLSEMSGKDLIKLICDKYEYEDWKIEESDGDTSVESFLEWSSDVNDDSSGDEWIRVYKK